MVKNMKSMPNTGRTIVLLNILKEYSDESHRISMPELIVYLEEAGYHADRRAVYASLEALKDAGYEIPFSRAGGKQGYYLVPKYSPSEILFLADAVRESPALSKKATQELSRKLSGELSRYERSALPVRAPSREKTTNNEVMRTIELLITAIASRHAVEFRYYDLTVRKELRFRRSSGMYHLLPVSILSSGGRFYCVFYSASHDSFANYRIDKMTNVRVTEEECDPVRFDAERWEETSFMMYRGEPVTVSLVCDLSLANIVFDRFGTDLLISEVTEKDFTVSIRTSLSPTLVSWILMFYDRLTVKAPEALKEELLAIADRIQSVYKKD